jgi:hypothetical protein
MDHLAWALYKRGETPDLGERKERNIYFPIATSREAFNKAVRQKLPGVRRNDIAIVRRCQPYAAGKRNVDRHFLPVLDELSRMDKHRTIQPVVAVPERGSLHIGEQTDCVFRRLSSRGLRATLASGRELCRLYVKKTGSNPDIDVEPRFTLDPSINERLTVEEFLKATISATRIVLRQFADPPASAEAILGRPIP